jgi:hypothetical protein
MAYSDFSLKQVKAEFGLKTDETTSLFNTVDTVSISDYLTQTLQRNVPLALLINTEKARSELIIINILLEIKERASTEISLFSGIDFNVDEQRGLNGYCDYIISASDEQLYLDTPIITIVEAKNDNLVAGIGQCLAEMVAAQLHNEAEQTVVPCLYGVVTTGDEWKFIQLKNHYATIDLASYYINEVEKIVAILLYMTQH